MTTSQKTPIQSELEGDAPLSPGTLGYLCANTRDAYFDYVHQKLAEAEARGVKRKDIARRMGKSPARFSHIIGAPGNWTLDTITELLAAIAGEELIPASLPLLRQRNHNCEVHSILRHDAVKADRTSIVAFGLAAPSAAVSAHSEPTYAPA